jgi:hypothetical protein
MAEAKRGASLVEGTTGGFLDNVVVTLKSHRTGEYKYPGGMVVNALIVEMVDEEGVEHVEAYSCGKATPLEDGTGFETALDVKCKAKRYIDSLLAQKFPNVDTDVRIFNGTKAHVIRQALPKMSGIDKEGDKDKTVLIVDKIIALPSAKKAGATTSRPTSTSAAATSASAPTAHAAANGNADLNQAARDLILTILATKPDNTVTRVKLSTDVMLAATKDPALKPNMMALKKLAGDAAWLVENSTPETWVSDGETVTLA